METSFSAIEVTHMKTRTIQSIVAAVAVVSSSIIVTGAAGQTMRKLGRVETHSLISREGAKSAAQAAPSANSATNDQTREVAASYPKYRLIDLGTFGGPESESPFPERGINNRGQSVHQAETEVPEPNCYIDCYINHPLLRQRNGNIIELQPPSGFDPTNTTTYAFTLTQNGLLGGFFTNGLIDPLTDFPEVRGVIWDRQLHPTELGTFGGASSQVGDRNNSGVTIGVALNNVAENPDFASFMANGPAATQARAFIAEDEALRDLGTLGGNDSFATAINCSATIFGMSYTDTVANETTGLPTVHPFLWKNGHMRDLGTLGGVFVTPGSFAYGPYGVILNDRGQAVGTSSLAGDEFWHAFLWDGVLKDLGTLGGNISEALAINNAGVVVGRSDFSPDSIYHHATLWRNGTIADLDVVDPCQNSTATAVNSSGDVVGGLGACTDNPDDLTYFSAFLWKKGQPMADLNDLVSPPSDLHIVFATGINDRGEIVGSAYLPTGEVRAVALVPLADQ